ncbi:MAG: PrsW family glutamic-type intramembrane protease [Anaerolineales bacterium]|nr:MAG: PrsW family glutamic-type intramembrane protease [Anaerolineales bacterium]
MQANKTHWASVLTLIVFGISAVAFLLISSGLGISSLVRLLTNRGNPAAEMISAFAFGFELFVLIVCSWFVLQKARGYEQANLPFEFPFAGWQVFAIIGVVSFSVIIGGMVSFTGIAWLGWMTLPVLTVLVIAPPIWLLFGIGANGLEIGPRWRVFAVLGLSMTLAPLIMLTIEIAALLGIGIGGSVLVAIFNPSLFEEILSLVRILELETNETVILNLLSPFITNPVAIATGIGYIAVLVPLVEELFKPLAVWLFARQIESPAQGFVMGLISGAAFALFESLNASADGSVSWAVIVSIRAGTSLLHMATSGLVGWGIVSAVKEKHIKLLVGAYLAATLVHGIWNACAAGMGLSVLGESVGRPEWLFNFLPALLCGLFVLGIGMFAVLLASNRKLRNTPAP